MRLDFLSVFYTQEELDRITQVHDEVASDCPDYATEIQALLATHENVPDVPEDEIPDAVTDLIAESLTEPEPEANGAEETATDDEDAEAAAGPSEEDRKSEAEERLNGLKAERVVLKQQLMDLESDLDALAQQHQTELEALKQQHQDEIEKAGANWTGAKTALTAELKPLKADHRDAVKEMKGEYGVRLKTSKTEQKERKKALTGDLKRLERAIPQAERDLKLLTNRGRLELILADDDQIGTLKERWIGAEVAKRLDYPIFMAVSERGGKKNSGDYEHVVDEDGSLVEFPDGHPQAGQLVVDQDLVNYDLTQADLADAAAIADERLWVAEAFVRFAQEQVLHFWGAD